MNKIYDSRQDTIPHILRVSQLLEDFRDDFFDRATEHDKTKLLPPEKDLFDEFTPKLKALTYGSDEYKVCLEALAPALAHHYANNSHHPEHYPNGIAGMDLLDVVEMLCDWKAASERHADGDIFKSLEINRVRFSIEPQLFEILMNTARRRWANKAAAQPSAESENTK